MTIFNVLSLVGGLALFLFGMSLMGQGLEKISGGKMEKILEKMTNTPIKGILLGTLVTAIIQSSSATTCMVVGFVNSGVMNLTQAIGIVMGSQIGTTATGWLLSLGSLEGSAAGTALKLLQPSSFTPLLAFVGIIFYTFLKKGKKRDVGMILLGFAVLMYGMSAMSGSVSALKDMPEFSATITAYANPVLAVLVGAILTSIIQSSSATVGIVQALSVTGAISVGMSIPLVMGISIGASTPCVISSIGANKNAKRAAFSYLYFNVIGTVLFLTVYMILQSIFDFSFVERTANAFDIALVNTVFNLFTAIILAPFTKKFEKLLIMTIPDRTGDEESVVLLDERFLKMPSFAIEQAHHAVNRMAEISRDSLYTSLDILFDYDRKKAEQINRWENETDKYEDKLGTYLLKISKNQLTSRESKSISKMLHSIGDLERIGDHADNMAAVAQEIYEKDIVFSASAKKEIEYTLSALREIVGMSCEAFINNDAELASHVEPLEQVIDLLKDELRSRHIERLQKAHCTIENGFVFNDMITNIERVSDHCSNLAVCTIQLKGSTFDTHEYLRDVKKNSDDFKQMYESYKEKYYLPINQNEISD